MSGFERYACRDSFPVCSWWTDKTGDWARRVRDHVEAAHPARPGLSLVPPANAQTLICRACHQLPCACPQDVIALPPGSVQSDARALDAQADCTCAAEGRTCQRCSDWFAAREASSFTAALHCRNPNGGCQTPRVCNAVGQCDIPRPAPAPILSWASSIRFAADSPAGLVEKVRAWLAEMDRLAAADGPTQTHGKEGTS